MRLRLRWVSLHFWRLGTVLRVEKFVQCTFLDGIDGIVIEPGRVTWNDNVMRLFARFGIVESLGQIGIALNLLVIRVIFGIVVGIVHCSSARQLRIVYFLARQC